MIETTIPFDNRFKLLPWHIPTKRHREIHYILYDSHGKPKEVKFTDMSSAPIEDVILRRYLGETSAGEAIYSGELAWVKCSFGKDKKSLSIFGARNAPRGTGDFTEKGLYSNFYDIIELIGFCLEHEEMFLDRLIRREKSTIDENYYEPWVESAKKKLKLLQKAKDSGDLSLIYHWDIQFGYLPNEALASKIVGIHNANEIYDTREELSRYFYMEKMANELGEEIDWPLPAYDWEKLRKPGRVWEGKILEDLGD